MELYLLVIIWLLLNGHDIQYSLNWSLILTILHISLPSDIESDTWWSRGISFFRT